MESYYNITGIKLKSIYNFGSSLQRISQTHSASLEMYQMPRIHTNCKQFQNKAGVAKFASNEVDFKSKEKKRERKRDRQTPRRSLYINQGLNPARITIHTGAPNM